MKNAFLLAAGLSLVNLPALAGTAAVVDAVGCGVAVSPTKLKIDYAVDESAGPAVKNEPSSRGIEGVTMFSTTTSEGKDNKFGLQKGRKYCIKGKFFLSPTSSTGSIESGTVYPQW